MSFRILLVDPDSLAAAASQQALVQNGYRVAPVSTFEEATRQMSLDYPDLLVTKARLGAFNGLHLLLRCRAEHPDVPVIIVGTLADRTADVTRFGAEFVTSPIEHASFLKVVASMLTGRTTLSGRPPEGATSARRGPRRRGMRPTMVSDRSGRTGESKHGTQVPIDIRVPLLGLSLDPVPGSRGQPTMVNSKGGAEVALHGSDVIRRWRWTTRQWCWMVDSLN
jgi:CheY-like chemotaxis protein